MKISKISAPIQVCKKTWVWGIGPSTQCDGSFSVFRIVSSKPAFSQIHNSYHISAFTYSPHVLEAFSMIHFFSLCWVIGDLDAGNCSLDGDDRTFFLLYLHYSRLSSLQIVYIFLNNNKKKNTWTWKQLDTLEAHMNIIVLFIFILPFPED